MSLKTLLKKLNKEPPLGWAQLSHQKVRLLVAVAGIAFADILIFMQLGFYNSIFGGVTRIHKEKSGMSGSRVSSERGGTTTRAVLTAYKSQVYP